MCLEWTIRKVTNIILLPVCKVYSHKYTFYKASLHSKYVFVVEFWKVFNAQLS